MKIEFRQSAWVDLANGEPPTEKTEQVTCMLTALLRSVPNGGLSRRLVASNRADAMTMISARGETEFRAQLRALRDELSARDLND